MISVFTPTYNRAYILDNLYRSLLSQTNKDFEWIVVDDGSTDKTEKYFNTVCSNNNGFNIIYRKQKNGGKHRAINHGVQLAHGELFFIVDSDDYLTEDAIEKLIDWYNTMENHERFCAISGARGYSREKYIGEVFDSSFQYLDIKNTERDDNHLSGDKAEAWFTDVLKKYPFPEFEGENFLAESVVWNAMACDGYLMRFYRDIIYICDYLEDGLTKNTDVIVTKNPRGYLEWIKMEFRSFPVRKRENYNLAYSYYSIVKNNKNDKEIAAELGISLFKLKMIITLGNAAVRKNK